MTSKSNDKKVNKVTLRNLQNANVADTQAIIQPYLPEIKKTALLLSKDVEDIRRTTLVALDAFRSINNFYPSLFQDIQRIRESFIPVFEAQKSVQAIIESITTPVNAFREMLVIQQEAMKSLRNTLLYIPDISKTFRIQLDLYKSFYMQVDYFEPDGDTYNLGVTTTERTELGPLVLQKVNEIHTVVCQTDANVEQLVTNLAIDNQHKDEMLNELLGYFRKGDVYKLVEVKRIKYKLSGTMLSINNTDIPISSGQMLNICSCLFKDMESLKNPIEYDDMFGDDVDFDPTLGDRMYHVVRRLSNKITLHTGIPNFLIYTKTQVAVNPNYHNMLIEA